MNISNVKYKVSVIITLYNRKNLIFRAIKSIENQTFNNFEVIIVDDGSEDKIEIDLIHYIKGKDNYKYLRHSNRKPALSLNTGILLASGEFITFLDSDDEYLPNHLEKRIEFFEEENNIELICSTAKLIGEEKEFYVPDVNDISKLIHINDCIIGATLFGKAEVFNKLNGFKDMYSYDSDFFIRANELGVKTKKMDLPTYIYYRNNPDSVINNFRESIKK
ncbi:MAG TPA: glycosyltransferase family A protein [Ignavibacteria bacterium]|nr:glycosyltransferase family A protein [Ignavibacteria bacterium]